MAKGDLFVESKHADVKLERGSDWSLWFFDTPKRGKCLSMEYIPSNWPSVTIQICSNTRAKRNIGIAKARLGFEQIDTI